MASDVSMLNSVHNFYMSSLSPKSTSRFDTHKKNELRNIYNSIVKLNKESPLYTLNISREARTFAVGIKEDARILRNSIAALGGLGQNELLNKRVAYSSNTDVAAASFVGDNAADPEVPSFALEVQSLASGQVNVGELLPNSKVKAAPDTYSFDVNINDLNYEFQYAIHDGEKNRDVQERLARLITNASIGIKAEVIDDGKGNSALRIRSLTDGLKNNTASNFSISDDHTGKKAGSVAYFGLDYLARPASNAKFLLNGEQHISHSNTFTLDKLYEVELKGVSVMPGEEVTIGLKTDLDSLNENISSLVNSYNHFVDSASSYEDNEIGQRRLLGEMKRITAHYSSNLDIIGLKTEESGAIVMDRQELKHAALSDYAKEDFSLLKDFTTSVVRKMNQISINPMDYTNRMLIAYKNPGKNFATPYITSAYSGMLFNGYC